MKDNLKTEDGVDNSEIVQRLTGRATVLGGGMLKIEGNYDTIGEFETDEFDLYDCDLLEWDENISIWEPKEGSQYFEKDGIGQITDAFHFVNGEWEEL